jgi:hypothetical protein
MARLLNGWGDTARYAVVVRRYLAPRCLGMHAMLLVLLPAFTWLTWWQYARASAGNTLSWAYVFLWPAFAVYAVYTWWNLVGDQVAHQVGADGTPGVGRPFSEADTNPGSRPPGWALTGGRKKNVALAATAPIDAQRGGRGERFTAQTPDEAERLAGYNRYLAELAAGDTEADAGSGAAR